MSLFGRLFGTPGPAVAAAPSAYHGVAVYDDDEELLARLEEYVLEGARVGHTTVVIATPEHRQRLRERLAVWEMEDAFLGLDADLMLSRFMRDGLPDRALFDRTVGALVRDGVGGGLRAYGEMVSLLWRDGNLPATVALEQLWNELQRQHGFSLLCAYSTTDIGDQRGLAQVCDLHSHVIPYAA